MKSQKSYQHSILLVGCDNSISYNPVVALPFSDHWEIFQCLILISKANDLQKHIEFLRAISIILHFHLMSLVVVVVG